MNIWLTSAWFFRDSITTRRSDYRFDSAVSLFVYAHAPQIHTSQGTFFRIYSFEYCSVQFYNSESVWNCLLSSCQTFHKTNGRLVSICMYLCKWLSKYQVASNIIATCCVTHSSCHDFHSGRCSRISSTVTLSKSLKFIFIRTPDNSPDKRRTASSHYSSWKCPILSVIRLRLSAITPTDSITICHHQLTRRALARTSLSPSKQAVLPRLTWSFSAQTNKTTAGSVQERCCCAEGSFALLCCQMLPAHVCVSANYRFSPSMPSSARAPRQEISIINVVKFQRFSCGNHCTFTSFITI